MLIQAVLFRFHLPQLPRRACASACLAGLLLIQGCSLGGAARSDQPPSPEELVAAGQLPDAARQYLQLAKNAKPGAAMQYRLRAAELFLQDGAVSAAEEILRAHLASEQDQQQLQTQALLLARIALHRSDTKTALRLLRPHAGAPFHELRAQAWEQSGRPGEASRELSALAWLQTQPARRETHARLWKLLSTAGLKELRQIPTRGRDHFSGWVELAIIDQSMAGKPEDWNTALVYWDRHFVDHPAAESVLPQLRERHQLLHPQPVQLAILLPQAGNFAAAAQTIREGIVASWYQDGPERPSLRLYDTYQQDIQSLLERAVEEGADFVIGPLEKEKVSALAEWAELEELPIRVLALNKVELARSKTKRRARKDSGKDFGEDLLRGLLQFGLSPENEARQIAQRAWFDGCTAALLATPEGLWGQRILRELQKTWLEIGGFPLEHARFDPASSDDYARWIRALLNIDNSEARTARLRKVLQRPLQISNHYRQDADCILLAANPEAARQIMPQLRYFGAEQIPVYASSRVYTGQIDHAADQDLDGIRFIDMPWILDPALADTALKYSQLMQQHGQDFRYERLFAFGLDAYQLIDQIGRLATRPASHHQGMSGNLSLQADGIISSQLQWAMFNGGRAVPLDPVLP